MFNKPTATGDYVHIYSKDPAVDVESEDYDHERWVETGDAKFLPTKTGASCVEFKLRHLASKDNRFIRDVAQREGEQSMAWWAVALGLRGIEPLVVDNKNVEVTFTIDNNKSRVSDEYMDLISQYDDGNLFIELAARVIRETFGNPTSSKG